MIRTFLATALIFAASLASAHSPLTSTSPAEGDVLAAAPAEVQLVFRRAMRMTKVTWTTAGGQSGQLDLTGYDAFDTKFALPFDGAVKDTYLIEWRGLSDDGHPQVGTFGFTIQ